MKSNTTKSKSLLKSKREHSNIKGKDDKATAQAYALIKKPACASVIPKSVAISVKSPMGINSEVLKIKAAKLMAITARIFILTL